MKINFIVTPFFSHHFCGIICSLNEFNLKKIEKISHFIRINTQK